MNFFLERHSTKFEILKEIGNSIFIFEIKVIKKRIEKKVKKFISEFFLEFVFFIPKLLFLERWF